MRSFGKLHTISLNQRLINHLEGGLVHPRYLHESQAASRRNRSLSTIFDIHINDLPSNVDTAVQPIVTDSALSLTLYSVSFVSDAALSDDYKLLAKSESAYQGAAMLAFSRA